MASVSTNPASNPQLAGILASQPMPVSTPRPNGTMTIGSETAGFSIHTQQPAAGASTPSNGQLVVGGGTTPAAGAQPAQPAVAGAPAATAPQIIPVTTTPATTVTGIDETSAAVLPTTSGFGKAERGATMTVDVDGAGFSFPSFNSTAKTNTAPAISWGPGWSKVEKSGMWFMQHANGMKAIPAVEYRVTPNPAEKVSTVKVANGWGKKFPDGTILVFDRKEGPYRLDAQGNKHKVALGTHTFGGVKVRVFEASVVRTLDKGGTVHVFDSRGNASTGSKRGNLAAALGSAAAGASTSGGGKGSLVGSGPTDGSGGKTVGGGVATLTADVQKLTELARSITAEIRSGNVDPARLTALQAQLSALPAGIAQAAGAAGTMTSNGPALRHGTEGHAATGAAPGNPPAPPTPGSSSASATPGSTTPGTTAANSTATTQGGGAPVAGVDANATIKALSAGATAKVDPAVIGELTGKQARFAQLPDALQAAVAKAYGSDQGAAAMKADQLISFAADGTVKLVEGGTVYTKHQAQVRGAGPGEEVALTVRPGRQPGSVGNVNANVSRPAARPAVSGGGSSTGSHANHTTTMPSTPGVTVAGGGSSTARSIKLFSAGGEFRSDKLGGITGSFTFKTLPAKAREALMAFISNPNTAAGKQYATRTGTGWQIDPNATIVIEAGYASFVNGLSMTRDTAPRPAAPTVSGGGPTNQPIGHNATRPPVTGGGPRPGVGTVAPGTPPPIPSIADPGERGHVGH